MAWIESHQELANHPKVLRLARLLDESRPTVIGYLHLLWWWALAYADDGNLADYSDEEIADAIGWDDDAPTLIGGLMEAGWLEEDKTLHDWWDYAGKLVERRQKDRERKRKATASPPPIRKTSTGTPPEGDGTAYVPNPTGPDPTQPDQKNGGKPRFRDELWDVFVEVHGQPASQSERGKFNKIVKTLREADVSAAEYPQLVQAYVSKYGGSQPAAATVAQRVGEMRNYLLKGPMQAPDAEQLRRDMEWAEVLGDGRALP